MGREGCNPIHLSIQTPLIPPLSPSTRPMQPAVRRVTHLVNPWWRSGATVWRHMKTATGNRGLMIREPLSFEQDTPGSNAVDFPSFSFPVNHRIGNVMRKERTGLPEMSEPQVMRHFVRLSQMNYSIDTGFYPLGSCTMKYNPRINEAVARLPGFADVHPLQPEKTVQGAMKIIYECAQWLLKLTGMAAISMTPAAGSSGELAGLMAIRSALEERGEHTTRKVCLIPPSAHGTNPASAAMCGFRVEEIKANGNGRVNVCALRDRIREDVACIMLTNPNTCGMFESDVKEVADIIHDAGAYMYLDGANFNAIVGRVRVADLGVDAMHLNLHKTFSTPHGGGGPGSGPCVLSKALAAHAAVPFVVKERDGHFKFVETSDHSLGRMKGFHGQMGMFVRALAFMMAYGQEGLREMSGTAVLNANYILARLKNHYHQAFPGKHCMHEVLFDDLNHRDTGVATLDIAKALIDEGFHPMTMYFPLVAHGAMLIEPTESESKATLDTFCDTMIHLLEKARDPEKKYKEEFHQAPQYAPTRRADEVRAARKPILRYVEK